ncbi:MAG: response regulator [Acidobacteria bacterium]|nr:response regulator [Acidobacteriota bacterium]
MTAIRATLPSPEAVSLRVLLVDDDEEDVVLTRGLFGEIVSFRFDVDWAPSYETADERLGSAPYDVVLLDYRLGARTGLELLRSFRKKGGTAPVIMLTGQGERELDVAAMEAGASDYLVKSRLDATLLDRSIRYSVEQGRAQRELAKRVAERTEELSRANEKLQEADQRKNVFLATLAHELRNPLSPVKSAIAILSRTDAPPDAHERARDVITRQVNHLSRLIDDLLDLGRITHGKLELRKTAVDLREALDSALETARPDIEGRGHRVDVTYRSPGPVLVEGDLVRLAQILANLLSNAARYTPPGGDVRVAISTRGGEAEVLVTDTGLGLSREDLDLVFEAFAQSPSGRGAESGGLGLGLHLARGLAVLHGGGLSAESEGRGRGSTFRLRLPLLGSGTVPVAGKPERRLPAAPRRILVVDDNRDAAESLAELLSISGHEVRTAYDGPGAILAAQAFSPDAIVLDIGLPGFDGHEAARKLRSGKETANALLIALTGWVTEDDRARSRDAGFDHHLAKPVDPDALELLLA